MQLGVLQKEYNVNGTDGNFLPVKSPEHYFIKMSPYALGNRCIAVLIRTCGVQNQLNDQ